MKPAREYDYYEILGVQYYATQEEIKRAFDKERRILPYNIAEARRKRALLDKAYFVLGNENRRYNYDRSRSNRLKQERSADQQNAVQSIKTLIILGMIRFFTGRWEIHVDDQSSERVKHKVDKGPAMIILLFLLVILIAAVLPAVNGWFANSARRDANNETKVLASDMIQRELPSSGETRCYVSGDPAAPLVIEASAEGTNYLIKLTDVTDGEKIVIIFVRGGERVETQVPLGYYELRYASGREWYGEEFLFGERTVYMKAYGKLNFYDDGGMIHGQRISLVNQIDQGLHLTKINRSEF